MEFPGIRIFRISGLMGLYGNPIARYGDVCMPDDSDKAWVCYLSRKPGRYPSESNKISIFYFKKALELDSHLIYTKHNLANSYKNLFKYHLAEKLY